MGSMARNDGTRPRENDGASAGFLLVDCTGILSMGNLRPASDPDLSYGFSGHEVAKDYEAQQIRSSILVLKPKKLYHGALFGLKILKPRKYLLVGFGQLLQKMSSRISSQSMERWRITRLYVTIQPTEHVALALSYLIRKKL
ncbi:uncharacterized protein LOC103997820 isoform X1 [Musa acuminata AAA Group]|uniref:uncharacterized protein LOC103997820 isoform X1 n=1 Tax=Musa acuminata AAA Group TaxID=214697 RepID=UPI0031DF6730